MLELERLAAYVAPHLGQLRATVIWMRPRFVGISKSLRDEHIELISRTSARVTQEGKANELCAKEVRDTDVAAFERNVEKFHVEIGDSPYEGEQFFSPDNSRFVAGRDIWFLFADDSADVSRNNYIVNTHTESRQDVHRFPVQCAFEAPVPLPLSEIGKLTHGVSLASVPGPMCSVTEALAVIIPPHPTQRAPWLHR